MRRQAGLVVVVVVAMAAALAGSALASGRASPNRPAAGRPAARPRARPRATRTRSPALQRAPVRGGFKIDSLTAAEVKALAHEWDTSVATGQMTVGAFRARHKLNKLDLYGLRERHPGTFQASRSRVDRLEAVDVGRLARAWTDEVAAGTRTAEVWLRANKLASTDLPFLRARKPGAFGRMRGRAWIDRMPAKEIDRLATSWNRRVNREGGAVAEFLVQEDLKPIDLDNLRTLRPGAFAVESKTSIDARTMAQMKRDWKRVEARELRSADFRARYKLSSGSMSLLRLRNPGDFEPIVVQPKLLTGADIDRLAAAYRRVSAGEMGVNDFLREQGISRGQLSQLRSNPEHAARFAQVGQTTATAGPAKVTSKQAAQAATFYRRYQLGIVSEVELQGELRGIGVTEGRQAELRAGDPERFASRTEFRARNFDRMVDHIIATARASRPMIHSVADVLERADRDPAFVAAFGRIAPGGNHRGRSWVLDWDRDRGGRLRAFMADELELKGVTADGRRARATVAPAREARTPTARGAARAGRGTRNDGLTMARELAAALRGKKPGPEELARTLAELARTSPEFGDHGRVVDLFYRYRGLMPELAPWRPGKRTFVSYRYVARWMQATHEAGPGASYDEVARVFKQSPEYLESQHLPFANKAGVPAWLMKMVRRFPGLVVQDRARRTFQTTRLLIEAVRTAPAGTSLEQIVAGQKLGPAYSVRGARHVLGRLTAETLVEMGFEPALLRSLRTGRGLGKARDPDFDPLREPPGVDMELVGKLLDMPEVPPLLELALRRQAGRRVFAGHNVLLINHLYSDAVPFVEALKRAGLSPDKSAIVSTEYPFDPAVSYALQREGIATFDDSWKRGMAATVEPAIRDMLRKSDGNGQPILILDDGGTAAELIRTRFADQADRFKIVEITTNGLFPAEQLLREHGRLPFVYRTTARSDTKRRIMSPVYAARVIDTAIQEIHRSGLELVGREAVVIGGGAMGAPAGAELVRRGRELGAQGLRVTFVDTDPATAATLRAAGFKVAPIARALPRAALVVGMATVTPGNETLREEHLPLLRDGVVVVQGASKRKQFDMARFEAIADRKDPLPGDSPRRSYRYRFGTKSINFLADGWTINHNGSLHGSPIDSVQLELGIVFENMATAAQQSVQRARTIGTLSAEVQEIYVREWQRLER
jgi:S-adenosylhomocysteine hydrolase